MAIFNSARDGLNKKRNEPDSSAKRDTQKRTDFCTFTSAYELWKTLCKKEECITGHTLDTLFRSKTTYLSLFVCLGVSSDGCSDFAHSKFSFYIQMNGDPVSSPSVDIRGTWLRYK